MQIIRKACRCSIKGIPQTPWTSTSRGPNGSKSIMTTGDRTADAPNPFMQPWKTTQTIIITDMQEVKEKNGNLDGTARFIWSSACESMASSPRFVGVFCTYQAGRGRRGGEVWLTTDTPGRNARQGGPWGMGSANAGPSFAGRRRR